MVILKIDVLNFLVDTLGAACLHRALLGRHQSVLLLLLASRHSKKTSSQAVHAPPMTQEFQTTIRDLNFYQKTSSSTQNLSNNQQTQQNRPETPSFLALQKRLDGPPTAPPFIESACTWPGSCERICSRSRSVLRWVSWQQWAVEGRCFQIIE